MVALRALYFASSDELIDRHVETTSNPVLVGRLTLEGESIVLASLMAVAVGNDPVIVLLTALVGAVLRESAAIDTGTTGSG